MGCGKSRKNWHFSTIYQVQTGFPSPFPFSATRQTPAPCWAKTRFAPMSPGSRSSARVRKRLTAWFNTAAFATPPAFTFGNVAATGLWPGMQTLDFALARDFAITESS